MKPGPLYACKILPEVIDLSAPPRPAVDWLTHICVARAWHTTASEAREAAERWETQFLSLVKAELNELHRLCRFAPYTFNSSSEYMLQGSAFIEPQDSPKLQEEKTKRAHFNEYVTALGELTPRQFEAMCTGILGILGVEKPILTKQSGDEGIDFYGHLKLEKHLFSGNKYPGLQHQLAVWLIGQAKLYKAKQVSTFDIRELVGTVELARGAAYGSGDAKYADLKLKVCDPVFYLFFTTGHISKNSWVLLEKSGVVGMDGSMVAAFLADRGIGILNNTFDKQVFLSWISQQLV